MARVARLFAYPFKSLDGIARDRIRLVGGGPLAGDRGYAAVDADGAYVNDKNERAIHRLRAGYETVDSADATPTAITLSAPDRGEVEFRLPDDAADLESWLEGFLGYPVELVRADEGGLPDDADAAGPTVISRATLETVASWYDGIDAAEMRRRLRPNVVLDDCPAFWEDGLFADRDSHVRFRVGDAELRGINPCQRCVVPSRDPDTGEEYPDFRETFIRKRRETMPDWSGGDWFDHEFRLMVNTDVPEPSRGRDVEAGDEVEVVETRNSR